MHPGWECAKCARISKETSVPSGEGARERGVGVEVREVTGTDGGESWGSTGAFGAKEWYTLV